MFTPVRAPSCRAHMPAQLTTYSHSMSPWRGPHAGHRAAVGQDVEHRHALDDPWHPACRAPLASDIVTSTGFARPSSAT